MKVKSLKDYRGLGKGNLKRTRAMLYMAHKASFANPGSSEFISIKDNQYHGFKKGLFQFTRKTARKNNAYPSLKKMYHGKGATNPTRHGKHWMRDAMNQYKQQEIDAIFTQESKRQLKKFGLI